MYIYSVMKERSTAINIPTKSRNETNNEQYSLKQHVFDPTKSSPPNSWTNRLNFRMRTYYDPLNKEHNLIK